MGIISRGIKDAFRNTIRTVSITFILALSIAMSLIMLIALKTVQAKISNVKSSIGNTITVTPAGVRGFEGGGELLTTGDLDNINSIAHIAKTTEVLSDRLTPNQDTNLVSAIDPGSFGNRMQARNGVIISEGTSRQEINSKRSFTMPITVTATTDFNVLASLSVSQFKLASGQLFDPNTTEKVALVGQEIAAKNNLSVGSTFQAYGSDVTVSGIFDTGNKFTNAALVMPIKTLQTFSNQVDQISTLIVQSDSIDTISSVQNEIKSKLGDKADVVSQQDTSDQALKPLENIKTISLYSLIGSLAAGSVIIFLTMLMIVRERRREIGVLKAIGSSNIGIVSQFTIEALVLTLFASIIGIICGFIFSNPVLRALIENSESTGNIANKTVQIERGAGMMVARLGGSLDSTKDAFNNIHAVLGWQTIGYGLMAAVIIAIIGSAIPAFFISKVRPAEVMRQE